MWMKCILWRERAPWSQERETPCLGKRVSFWCQGREGPSCRRWSSARTPQTQRPREGGSPSSSSSLGPNGKFWSGRWGDSRHNISISSSLGTIGYKLNTFKMGQNGSMHKGLRYKGWDVISEVHQLVVFPPTYFRRETGLIPYPRLKYLTPPLSVKIHLIFIIF